MALFWGADHEVPQSQVSLDLVLFNIATSDLMLFDSGFEFARQDVMLRH